MTLEELKTLSDAIAKKVSEFLEANNGMGNGYETYARGKVTKDSKSVEVYIGSIDSRKHMSDLGSQLGREIQKMISSYIITITIKEHHMGYGCFRTSVEASINQTSQVIL